MHENPDPYTVLGVTPTATQAEITHAYRTQLRSLHPDTRQAPAQTAAVADARLQHILAAYGAVREPHHRADDGRAPPATTTQPRRSDPPTTPHTSPNPQRPVQIPVTHHEHIQTPPEQRPPLWAGPVRHHH